MAGKPLRDQLPEDALDFHVDLGDEIDRAFLVHANRLAEMCHLHVAGANDGFNCGCEKEWVRSHRERNAVS